MASSHCLQTRPAAPFVLKSNVSYSKGSYKLRSILFGNFSASEALFNAFKNSEPIKIHASLNVLYKLGLNLDMMLFTSPGAQESYDYEIFDQELST